jgi:hypothetical protein
LRQPRTREGEVDAVGGVVNRPCESGSQLGQARTGCEALVSRQQRTAAVISESGLEEGSHRHSPQAERQYVEPHSELHTNPTLHTDHIPISSEGELLWCIVAGFTKPLVSVGLLQK